MSEWPPPPVGGGQGTDHTGFSLKELVLCLVGLTVGTPAVWGSPGT